MGRSVVRSVCLGAARAVVLALAAFAAAAAPAQGGAAALKSVETGLGFSISVPETWAKGQPAGNNKFVMGSRDDDFAVIVADFGPLQPDAAGRRGIIPPFRDQKKTGPDQQRGPLRVRHFNPIDIRLVGPA